MNSANANVFSGLVDRTESGRLWIVGPDRVKFLNNLCTQDVAKLAIGQGAEAFITSLQGRTLAYFSVHVLADALLLRTERPSLRAVLPYLQKYGVFDEIELDDRSEATCEWSAIGPHLAERLAPFFAGFDAVPPLGILTAEVDGQPAFLIRDHPLAGQPAWTLIAPAALHREWGERLGPGQEVWTLSDPLVEGARILAGIPRAGRDVTDANLPQEFDRNAHTISFHKGCYLGQETVARLDALGHVNRLLRRVVCEAGSTAPAIGSAVKLGGVDVGVVTSTGLAEGSALALAMLNVKKVQVGNEVQVLAADGSSISGIVQALGGGE